MRRRLFPLLVLFVVCLSPAFAQSVVESESSVVFGESAAELGLTVDNTGAARDTVIEAELIDTAGTVRASISQSVKLEAGRRVYPLTLPTGELLKSAVDNLAWYRIRWRIGPENGVISVSRIARGLFELRVIASANLLSGMTYRTRVRATDPLSGKPVPEVDVEAVLKLRLQAEGDAWTSQKADGRTDSDGFVSLDFPIPVDAVYDGDAEIAVTGRRNGLIREAEEDVRIDGDDYAFIVLADKPIYQPEQSLNVRAVLFKGGESRTVLARTEVEFRVEDEDDTVVYREKAVTSDFGVASMSWMIPESAKLGQYLVRVRVADRNEGSFQGTQRVRVSRYDLPNFAVRANSVKPYYLPNERTAEIEVYADYLFGKPVANGRVRVVRENGREWNFKEQKYEIDEGDAKEGKADKNGKFTARFDLSEDLEELGDDRFDDLGFTAYVTDPTTNRTEQRRFDVRITREPIHVYYIGRNYGVNPNLPVEAFVSAFYADGTPAVCDVEFKGREEDSDSRYRTILRTKTNAYGAGRLEYTRPKFEDEDADLEIQLIARDREGRRGTLGIGEDMEESVSFDTDDDAIRIRTDRTVFRPGEDIRLQIESTVKSGVVYVDAVRGWSVAESAFAYLKDGRAELRLPYRPEYRGLVKLAAYVEDEDGEPVRTSRGVIFPAPETLKVDAAFDRATYKPGQDALVNFGVTDPLGKPALASLGVVIIDRAVEERARTDADFGGMFGGLSGWLGYGDSFGGVNVKDLNELDPAKPVSDDLQLVAEVMLHNSYYSANIFQSTDFYSEARSAYAPYFRNQFEEFEKRLGEHYEKKEFDHPVDDESFRRIVTANGLAFEKMSDPWDRPYRVRFSVDRTNDVLEIVSAGPDREAGTADDIVVSRRTFAYFTPVGKRIDAAVKAYNARTGGFIRDERTLLAELGVAELRDRFGNPYHFDFGVAYGSYRLTVRSRGLDGKLERYYYQGDDFTVWSNDFNYFTGTERRIGEIVKLAKEPPLDVAGFRTLLAANGIDPDELRDGWGERVYFTVVKSKRYSNRVTIENVTPYGEDKPVERRTVTPVTQEIVTYTIRSRGEDKVEGNWNDFNLGVVIRVLTEQTKDDEKPKPVVNQPIAYRSGTGAVSGTVVDANGSAVPGATVTATADGSEASRSTTTGSAGNYTIANLAPGRYTVAADYPGFKRAVRPNVPVTAGSTTRVDLTLEVGTVDAVVEVSAESNVVNTTDASVSKTIAGGVINPLPAGREAQSLALLAPGTFQIDGASGSEEVFVLDGKKVVRTSEGKIVPFEERATPRLREYFPEMLVWSPDLRTDADGRARLAFRMADTITTWKLYSLATTKDGRVGAAEKEIGVFQPFFVDLDPPKFLTDGDEIHLPAQIRNYTETRQRVGVTMDRADWFDFLSPERQSVDVDRGAAANAVFGFRAVRPVKAGKQRVTAEGQTDSDAIEKPVTVRPNGEEIVRADTRLFRGRADFDLGFPANALPRSERAELKIYPNLMAHVTEAVDGLLARPYGCGEQTVSSTYPNLMILRFADKDRKPSVTEIRARRFLKAGYERLLSYQGADGGFTYWGGKSESDVALTAYALRFLNDAAGLLETDPRVVERARAFLAGKQRGDGSWTVRYSWEQEENRERTKRMTAYVARSLAAAGADKAVLDKALAYLKLRNLEIDDPYSLANWGLAAIEAGDLSTARQAVEKLQPMAIREGDRVYWNLEQNTPFFGWGSAARIESTALALQLLVRFQAKDRAAVSPELVSGATMFLLRNKDRYGVWYSTQATIGVLEAFLASLTPPRSQTLTVTAGGRTISSIPVPADRIEPVIVDLNDSLAAGPVGIEGDPGSALMAQVVRAHHIDWKDSASTNRNVNQSRAVKLDYACDRTAARITETITCSVAAERIGFQGYGMLLAEIGIPPGAEVSRESLESAMAADWSLSRYEIRPDRIVFYMWAKAGGTRFTFTFKPRYGINAQTPASVLYDYYNEEARAVVEPIRFVVR